MLCTGSLHRTCLITIYQYDYQCSAVHFHNYSDTSQFIPRGTSNITVSFSLHSGYKVSCKSEFFEIWLWRTSGSAVWVRPISRATPRVRGSSTSKIQSFFIHYSSILMRLRFEKERSPEQFVTIRHKQIRNPTSMFGKTACWFAPIISLYLRSSTDSADWCCSTTGFSQISFQQFVKLDEFVVNVHFQIVFIGRHKPLSSRTNIIPVIA